MPTCEEFNNFVEESIVFVRQHAPLTATRARVVHNLGKHRLGKSKGFGSSDIMSLSQALSETAFVLPLPLYGKLVVKYDDIFGTAGYVYSLIARLPFGHSVKHTKQNLPMSEFVKIRQKMSNERMVTIDTAKSNVNIEHLAREMNALAYTPGYAPYIDFYFETSEDEILTRVKYAHAVHA